VANETILIIDDNADTRLLAPYFLFFGRETNDASERRTKRTAFLSILRGVLFLSQTCGPVKFWHGHIIVPQPARRFLEPSQCWPYF
jgi:hypothetical protein